MVDVIFSAGAPAQRVDTLSIRGIDAPLSPGSMLAEYTFYRFFHMSPFANVDGDLEPNYEGLTRYSTPEIPYGLLIASKEARVAAMGLCADSDTDHPAVVDLDSCRKRLAHMRARHADFKTWAALEWLARYRRTTMTEADDAKWKMLGEKYDLKSRAVKDAPQL